MQTERNEARFNCWGAADFMQKYIFLLTPPNFLDYFNADCAIGPTDKNSPTDELISHRSHTDYFHADYTSTHLQVTVAQATENLWKSVQSVGE